MRSHLLETTRECDFHTTILMLDHSKITGMCDQVLRRNANDQTEVSTITFILPVAVAHTLKISMDPQELLLQKAIVLAHQVHAQQVDKAGKPYINHPLRVMATMETCSEKIVAILHDAVEDSDLTLEDLHKVGLSGDMIEAIAAITKNEGENYEVYLQRVMENAIALKVKIADMTDNMNISRIANPTEKDWQRLVKYQQILPKLISHQATQG